MSLIDNLNTIKSCKEDIKTALENKGVDMTGVSFPDYASKIGEIKGGVIHPSNKLVETITSNGNYSYSGEYAGAEIMVNVPGGSKPEESLVETITSNGSYSFLPNSGSVFSEASITVNVPSNDIVTMTQAEYNALSNKNPNTIYLING